jgi:hypothetical protein
MVLTSCLEGNNKVTGSAYGVLTTSSNYFTLVLNSTIPEIGPISSPQLTEWFNADQMALDKCYAFKYELDLGSPENSYASLQANGYFTVKITEECSELSTHSAEPNLTDTGTALENEVSVISGFVASESAYAAGYMYAQQKVNQPEDQQLEWSMSYDYSTLYNPAVVNGVRYYDLYVRAVKKTEGTQPNKEMAHLNAYYVWEFFRQAAENEKTQLSSNYDIYYSTFKFRVFYVSEINDGKLSWQYVPGEVYIASFVSE